MMKKVLLVFIMLWSFIIKLCNSAADTAAKHGKA
jgi:hypothetical protein